MYENNGCVLTFKHLFTALITSNSQQMFWREKQLKWVLAAVPVLAVLPGCYSRVLLHQTGLV